ARVGAQHLRLRLLRHADRAHLAHRAPRVRSVVVVGVARPERDVLEEIPLPERRRLVRLEGDEALLAEGLRGQAVRLQRTLAGVAAEEAGPLRQEAPPPAPG